MRSYNISFTIPETLLATIVSLLTPEVSSFQIAQVSVLPLKNGHDKSEVMQIPTMPKIRTSPKKSVIQDIILGILEDGKHHKSSEFEKALVQGKWAKSSFHPGISDLMRSGKVRSVTRGVYEIRKDT